MFAVCLDFVRELYQVTMMCHRSVYYDMPMTIGHYTIEVVSVSLGVC